MGMSSHVFDHMPRLTRLQFKGPSGAWIPVRFLEIQHYWNPAIKADPARGIKGQASYISESHINVLLPSHNKTTVQLSEVRMGSRLADLMWCGGVY